MNDIAGDTGTDKGLPVATVLACLVAVIAMAGSLWLSMGMSLKACPLCLYQRTFVMGVVGVLVLGLASRARGSRVLNLLALPLAIAPLGVAGFHEYLELTGKLECPAGMFELGSAPQQSLAVLTLLTILLFVGAIFDGNSTDVGAGLLAGAFLLGAAFAVAAIASAPPMPPTPPTPYKTDLDICRPPFRGMCEDPDAKAANTVADTFIVALSDGKTHTMKDLATKTLQPFLAAALGPPGEMNSAKRSLTLETFLPLEGKASVRGTIPLSETKEAKAGLLQFELTLVKEDGRWKVDSLKVEDVEQKK